MARPHLLLVDADPRAVRVLEVNLKNDGFSVTTATDGAEAASKLEIALPDVLVAETRLSRVDGFELVRRLRSLPGGENVAVVLIAPEPGGPGPNGLSAAATDQLRAVELGIADCLCKPVSVRELVTRVNLMLARRTRAMLSANNVEQTHFSGHLQDIGVIDLLSAFEAGRRSGVLQIEHGARSATVLFTNGKVVDAEQGPLRGEEALYRTLLWTTGVFDVEFVEVDVPDNVPVGTAALIMEGMRRIDEWGRLAEQLPSSTSVFTVDAEVLLERLAEVPDELNPVLRLFDGERSLMGVIDESPFDDLSTLSVVSKLYFEGVLRVNDAAQPSVLLSARALGHSPKASGNVIKLPHVASPAPVIVRPHAPDMGVDPLPRSLVYSEPPQSLRLSQRPKTPGAVTGATLPGIAAFASVLPSSNASPASEGAAESASHVVDHPSNRVAVEAGARPVSPAPATTTEPHERGGTVDNKRAVAEAEFEDLPRHEREALARAASTNEVARDVDEPVSRAPTSDVATSTRETSVAPATIPAGERPASEPQQGTTHKSGKELDHDFFAEGEQGAFELGRDDEPHEKSRPEVDIDPQVLAALQARRDQGRRWAAWIVGVAVLLLVWGLFAVMSGDDEQAPVAAGGKQVNTAAPVATPAPQPVEPAVTSTAVTTPPAEATEVATFEPVSTGSAAPKLPPAPGAGPGVGAAKPAPGLETPPLPKQSGSKKPPTARFPSTPEHQ